MKKLDEVPEAEIDQAEGRAAAHGHGAMDDDALLTHLRSVHGLDTREHLSRPTLDGLHDRLHQETDAAAGR